MKKGKKVFLASLLAIAVSGVATASALIVSGASLQTPPQGSTDQVLYLEWGDTVNTAQVSNLTPDAPAYRMVSVAAPVRSEHAPYGLFTAALSVDTGVDSKKEDSAVGISVSIYNAPFKQDGTPGDGAVRVGDGDLTISSTPITEVVTAAKTYYLKITISQSAYAAYIADNATSELAAKITLSYGANNA